MPDTDLSTFLWLYTSTRGRLGRLPFFLAMLLMAVILTLFLYLAGSSGKDTAGETFWAGVFLLGCVASLWLSFALAAKRAHDFGQPTIMGILMILPLVSVVAFIAFCFIPGHPGPNAFGASTNSRQA
ncbi:MAG: DUF805 domain-containing protein [Notoacmeibacter sp.]|nr:DUF805 domain-containing protein [Notoacmeibacter sp.]MCC0032222.1 DUF805 domain-containing protein [Brucellaceae bacterium]